MTTPRQKLTTTLFTTLLLLAPQINAQPNLEKSYNTLLKKYTNARGVRYAKIKKENAIKPLVLQLQKLQIPNGKNQQLAYWINAYNIMTIKLIVDHYPIKSITELHLAGSPSIAYVLNKTIWKTWKFQLHKKTYTLDAIEHKIIRKKFADYRIHAALVCAAKSCPPLRRESYTGKKLNSQLNAQMKQWLGNTKKNRYNQKTNTLHVSKIFKWFSNDFTNNKTNLLQRLKPYLPTKTGKSLSNKTHIEYLSYDWSLNSAN